MSGFSLTLPVLFLSRCALGLLVLPKTASDALMDWYDLPEDVDTEALVLEDPCEEDHRDIGETCGTRNRVGPGPGPEGYNAGPQGSLAGPGPEYTAGPQGSLSGRICAPTNGSRSRSSAVNLQSVVE